MLISWEDSVCIRQPAVKQEIALFSFDEELPGNFGKAGADLILSPHHPLTSGEPGSHISSNAAPDRHNNAHIGALSGCLWPFAARGNHPPARRCPPRFAPLRAPICVVG